MKATRDQVTPLRRSLRLGGCSSSEEDPATERKVTEEVGEEHEQHPPQRVHPVQTLVARLYERQMHGNQPGQQQDPGVEPEQQEDQHAVP